MARCSDPGARFFRKGLCPVCAGMGGFTNRGGPVGLSPSADYRVWVGGRQVFVYASPVPAAWCSFELSGPVTVTIKANRDIKWVDVRPLSAGVHPVFSDSTITFTLSRPGQLSIELNGSIRLPLFLFADAPEGRRPEGSDARTIFFAAGRVYHPGVINMKSGQTLYIEAGAIVVGSIHAEGASDIHIAGRGVLDGSGNKTTQSYHRSIDLVDCRHVRIEDITLSNSNSWQIVPIHCNGVHITNVKIVSDEGSDDGMDIVRSRNVTISHCFVRTKDDCIAIKSNMDYPPEAGVDSVTVQHCVFWNGIWGNALEIGFELNSAVVEHVLFRDDDIIHVQDGAAFSIHDAGKATVQDIRYENIRIEDANQKLIDLAIIRSRYSEDSGKDAEENKRLYLNGAWDGVLAVPAAERAAHAVYRGHIRRISFRDIRIVDGPFPYSVFYGFDQAHAVEKVRITNLTVRGRKIRSLAEAKCYLENARGVGIKASPI